jgi:Flp pilus assembly protein TadB
MPPKKQTAKRTTTRTSSQAETRRLEKLIRETIHSEMAAQQSRKETTNTYIQRLDDIDKKVTEFIEQAINETTRAYRLSVDSLFIGYLAAFFILVFGLALAIFYTNSSQLFTIAILFIAIGLIWVISLRNRNITKNNKSLVNNLAKLNIIFAGYIRQLHQVDMVFEAIVGSGKEISSEKAEQLLNSLQDTMAEAMNSVTSITNESDD